MGLNVITFSVRQYADHDRVYVPVLQHWVPAKKFDSIVNAGSENGLSQAWNTVMAPRTGYRKRLRLLPQKCRGRFGRFATGISRIQDRSAGLAITYGYHCVLDALRVP